MKNRKGAFEMPITWLYVIIIGAFVIFLFTRISFTAVGSAERENADAIVNYFNRNIELFSETTNQMGYTELPNIEFEIPVFDDGFSRIRYKGQEKILKNTIFSKNVLQGNISYWSYSFAAGYKSSPMLFLTDKKTAYVLLYLPTGEGSQESRNLLSAIRNEMPGEHGIMFNIQFAPDSITYGSNDRFICLNHEREECHITVNSSESAPYVGEIKFRNSGNEYYYYNYGMLFSAIFAHDEFSYASAMNVALKRHEVLSGILYEKAETLQATAAILQESEDEESQIPVCINPSAYAEIKEQIKIINSTVIENKDPEKVLDAVTKIRRQNNLLAQGNCERVY